MGIYVVSIEIKGDTSNSFAYALDVKGEKNSGCLFASVDRLFQWIISNSCSFKAGTKGYFALHDWNSSALHLLYRSIWNNINLYIYISGYKMESNEVGMYGFVFVPWNYF